MTRYKISKQPNKINIQFSMEDLELIHQALDSHLTTLHQMKNSRFLNAEIKSDIGNNIARMQFLRGFIFHNLISEQKLRQESKDIHERIGKKKMKMIKLELSDQQIKLIQTIIATSDFINTKDFLSDEDLLELNQLNYWIKLILIHEGGEF